jgi:hypothetical protein
MLPFHIPLIEPDSPISRIQLAEKVSRCRPRESARPLGKADEAQHFVLGIPPGSAVSPPITLLGTQPLT